MLFRSRDGLNFGIYNQEYTTAEITLLLDRNALPIIRRGTVFFDTDLGKLKVIVIQAVTAISDGVTETITSV